MLTTGSKLLIGATVVSVISAILFGITVDGPGATVGVIGLLSAAVAFGLIAGINVYVRDSNAPAMEPGVEHTCAAARQPSGASGWPAVAAVGVAGLAIGAVSRPVVFLVALVVVLAAIVEWMVQAWSERASDDTGYNATIRGRLLHPLEFPVLATLGLGALIYGFSRIMLSASKDAGRWLFIAIGALFLAGAVVVAIYRGAGKRTIAGVSALAAFAVVGVGVASAVQGQRDIEAHPAPSCLSNEEGEGDHGAPKAPSDTAGVYATIVLTDSDFYAVLGNWNGPDKIAYHQLSVPRNARVSLVFLKQTSEPARLTARLGKFGDAAESVECTAMVEADGEGYLSIKAVNVPLASTEPMQLQLGGEEAPAIEIQVP